MGTVPVIQKALTVTDPDSIDEDEFDDDEQAH